MGTIYYFRQHHTSALTVALYRPDPFSAPHHSESDYPLDESAPQLSPKLIFRNTWLLLVFISGNMLYLGLWSGFHLVGGPTQVLEGAAFGRRLDFLFSVLEAQPILAVTMSCIIFVIALAVRALWPKIFILVFERCRHHPPTFGWLSYRHHIQTRHLQGIRLFTGQARACALGESR